MKPVSKKSLIISLIFCGSLVLLSFVFSLYYSFFIIKHDGFIAFLISCPNLLAYIVPAILGLLIGFTTFKHYKKQNGVIIGKTDNFLVEQYEKQINESYKYKTLLGEYLIALFFGLIFTAIGLVPAIIFIKNFNILLILKTMGTTPPTFILFVFFCLGVTFLIFSIVNLIAKHKEIAKQLKQRKLEKKENKAELKEINIKYKNKEYLTFAEYSKLKINIKRPLIKMIWFPIIFMLIGGGVLGFGIYKSAKTIGYTKTVGTVVAVETYEDYDSDDGYRTMHRAIIEYKVNDVSYRFKSSVSSSVRPKIGSTKKIAYDPKDIEGTVCEPDSDIIIIIAGSIFVAAGLLFLFIFICKKEKSYASEYRYELYLKKIEMKNNLNL